MSNNNKIAKNTFVLYVRQIFILIVTLYSVRIVLNTLGVIDYGIFNVIAGIVSFFAFLSGTMASASQRFFSFALGKNDNEAIKKIFSINILIYFLVAISAFILLETLGLWFFEKKLLLPIYRIDTSRFVYHISVVMFISTIISTPFMAIIIANEDMRLYAFISIFEVTLKLTAVFLLQIISWDKLKLYSLLTLIPIIISTIIYIICCLKKYSECQFKIFYWDKILFKEIVKFTGWTLFGQVSSVIRNQAVTILLNQTFNPVIVAARVIAINISTQLNIFSNNFNLGIYPSIIKAHASGKKEEFFSLVYNGSVVTFSLMWIFALPFFLEMDTILKIWLNNPPSSTLMFTRLSLIEVLISSISLPLMTAARAPGKMMHYEITLGFIQIIIFVASWQTLVNGNPAYYVFVIAIIANLLMFIIRLLFVKKLIGLSIRIYFIKVVFPIFKVIVLSSICSVLFHSLLPGGIIAMFFSFIISFLISLISVYIFGIEEEFRKKLRLFLCAKLKSFSIIAWTS